MAITKTLGGDRLGSGKKMKVTMHGYERSTHDLGYVWRSTMSPGTLVPFIVEPALPGDTFDIDLNCEILTHPTIGPLFGSYKVQLDVFQCPIRLYNAMLHNNKLNIGRNMSAIKLPIQRIEVFPMDVADIEEAGADLNTIQINPSSIMAYLGVKGLGFNTGVASANRDFNGVPYIAYWDIYKNYYANKQEEIGAVIHSEISTVNTTVTSFTVLNSPYSGTPTAITTPPAAPVSAPITLGTYIQIPYTGATPNADTLYVNTVEKGWMLLTQLADFIDATTELQGIYNGNFGTLTITQWRYRTKYDLLTVPPQVVTFPLTNLDDMREAILQHDITAFIIRDDANYAPYSYSWDDDGAERLFISQSQEGLAVKTYQSDLFNNWIETEWIDGAGGITEITAIDTSGGSFTLDTLNLSKKVYDMLNRIAVSGGTYDDWLDVQYDHDRYQRCETPMYMGGLIKELVFQEVVSNSESSTGQPLGTLAGKGTMAKKHKGGSVVIKVDEPSYIIGLVSITPRVDYSQGNKWDTGLLTVDDLHKPALDEIGFQELITEQMAAWDTHWNGTEWIQKSAGKQPAWINYMTNVNRTYGNFAIPNNEMFMTLNRRYEYDSNADITDLTTYIDPAKFNFIFAETALDAQNFWTQIGVNMTARRKMSAKLMPNL